VALSGFQAKNHPQQTSRRWPDDVDEVDDHATHPLDFADFTDRFGPFTLDVAASPSNRKCERHFTRRQDGLAQDWTNPPLWIGDPCCMCEGTGADRLPGIACRACNGHGREPAAAEIPERERIWCNPPYSDIAPWVRKAWDCWASTAGIVMLLPANRTEQQWWQLLVEPFRDRGGSPLSCEFLPGRMRFLKPGQTAIGPNNRPPFGCVLLVWDPHVDATLTYQADRIPAGGLFEKGEA
jgi:hypothetical protein